MEDYFATASAQSRPILEEIRRMIEHKVPGAKATISYQMPAFKTQRVFIYFAAFKNHIGIYPPVLSDPSLESELALYRGEKGNLRFPLDRPMPYGLIECVIEALANQAATARS
jgi:uncharacterized protein YdhG (YjbR/CyaY superfamily)